MPLIALISSILDKAGVKVDHQSQAAAQTDFTALSNRAKAEGAKVVVLGSQVASNAQLFFQQLKSRGYTGGFLGTDGTFDSTKFTVPGAYISSFSLDIHDVAIAKPYTAAFEKQYGQTNSFGAPSWVAVQTIAMGISRLVCRRQDEPRRGSPRHRQGQAEDLAPRQADRVRQVRRRGRRRRLHDLPDRERRQATTSCRRARQVQHARRAAHPRDGPHVEVRSFRDARAPGRRLLPGLPADVELLLRSARRRAHARQPVRADRARLLDGVRDPEAPQLRPRRGVHDRLVHRLLRPHGVRGRCEPRHPGRAPDRPHVRGRDARLGRASASQSSASRTGLSG